MKRIIILFAAIALLVAAVGCSSQDSPAPMLEGDITIVETHGETQPPDDGPVTNTGEPVDGVGKDLMFGLWDGNYFVNNFAGFIFLLPGSYAPDGENGGEGAENTENGESETEDGDDEPQPWLYATIEDLAEVMGVEIHESMTYEEYASLLFDMQIGYDMMVISPTGGSSVISMFQNLTYNDEGADSVSNESYLDELMDDMAENPSLTVLGPEEMYLSGNTYSTVLAIDNEAGSVQQFIVRKISVTHMHIILIASVEGNIFDYVLAHFG